MPGICLCRGDVLRAIDNHHAPYQPTFTFKDIRKPVVDGLDRKPAVLPRCRGTCAFTVPGDGSLDFGASSSGWRSRYEGWSLSKPNRIRKAPPQKMAEIGHAELMRVMTASVTRLNAGVSGLTDLPLWGRCHRKVTEGGARHT